MKAIQPSKTIPRTNDLDKRVCEPASVHWAVVVVALVFIRKITTGSPQKPTHNSFILILSLLVSLSQIYKQTQKKKGNTKQRGKNSCTIWKLKKEISLQYEKAQSIQLKKKGGDQAKKGNFGIRVD